ncbi:RNA polymerase sigma factor [Gaetbulibacter sp. M235]|uniref:RNA polymerase sigma factor n=1 Tax=Gaetbulibacter sp. M235 TaxID=3126510 RepID=UPI00374F9887
MIITEVICKQLSDKEIVKKSLVDIEYFSCMYDRYKLRLLRYIKRIALVNDEQAKDILQEAFIKIWRNLNDYDQSLKLSSWIYRIVHNETISYWRKQKSFGKDRQVTLDETLFKDVSINFEMNEDNEQKERLTHEVLKLLPLKYKTVLVLKFMENMSYHEISDVLKIPEGTVATWINRAKNMFIKEASNNHISFFN